MIGSPLFWKDQRENAREFIMIRLIGSLFCVISVSMIKAGIMQTGVALRGHCNGGGEEGSLSGTREESLIGPRLVVSYESINSGCATKHALRFVVFPFLRTVAHATFYSEKRQVIRKHVVLAGNCRLCSHTLICVTSFMAVLVAQPTWQVRRTSEVPESPGSLASCGPSVWILFIFRSVQLSELSLIWVYYCYFSALYKEASHARLTLCKLS